MRVRDLQEFLSTFTASNKAGTRQGNAVSDAVLDKDPWSFIP
jgi:hypothetical protein